MPRMAVASWVRHCTSAALFNLAERLLMYLVNAALSQEGERADLPAGGGAGGASRRAPQAATLSQPAVPNAAPALHLLRMLLCGTTGARFST